MKILKNEEQRSLPRAAERQLAHRLHDVPTPYLGLQRLPLYVSHLEVEQRLQRKKQSFELGIKQAQVSGKLVGYHLGIVVRVCAYYFAQKLFQWQVRSALSVRCGGRHPNRPLSNTGAL